MRRMQVYANSFIYQSFTFFAFCHFSDGSERDADGFDDRKDNCYNISRDMNALDAGTRPCVHSFVRHRFTFVAFCHSFIKAFGHFSDDSERDADGGDDVEDKLS